MYSVLIIVHGFWHQASSSFYTPPAHLLFSVKWHFEWLALLQMESTAAHRLKTEKPLVEALKTL